MTHSLLGRQLRAVLGNHENITLAQLLMSIDDFVLTTSETESSQRTLNDLNDELHTIHDDCADHSPYHLEVFLAVLFHLCPITSPISIISSWFDLVIRPALREPKLPTVAVNHAKELVILALQEPDNITTEASSRNKKAIPSELRRRLMDLYLLDAFNETSGGDILEWAELDQDKKDVRACWKLNLEDVLLRYGAEHPSDLLTEVYIHFASPSARLQLLMFLNMYTADPSFLTSAGILASHPLTTSLLSCLLLDNSSTVCQVALTLLAKILPVFAGQASTSLKSMLPSLLAILARMMCWKERLPFTSDDEADISEDLREVEENVSDTALQLRDDYTWERLELTFETTLSTPPSPRPFFTMLYYLFPCNVLLFIREPVRHLVENDLVCPYTTGWEEILDETKIRSKSESLLRTHACHPSIVWRDGPAELTECSFWAQYDVSRIVSEASLLDLRNATLSLHASPSAEPGPTLGATTPSHRSEASEGGISDDFHISRHTQNNTVISLEDMIETSVALRFNANLEIVAPTSQWSSRLVSRAKYSGQTESLSSSSSASEQGSHVPEAMSALQREVLLLRNELNFEQWLSRENAKHIGRLYHDRILSKNAEAERQGLFNKLRKYRAQVVRLEAELKEHKEQASSAKNKYADWNTELQKKLRELREEKKAWITEAAVLRTAEKQAKALFEAQETLLSEATQEVTSLKTQITENQHKIDRLRDYERQIDQHIKMQRLWEDDFRKFNERADQIELMKNGWKQLELRLESYEKAQLDLEDVIKSQREEIQNLQKTEFAQPKATAASGIQRLELYLKDFQQEKARMAAAQSKMKSENAELKEEVEELRAMVELLKSQVGGRRGLVSEPRASPVQFV